MPTTPFSRSPISSLVASRRKHRDKAGPVVRAARQATEGLIVRLARTGPGVLEGHVLDVGEPDRRFVVELLLNGHPAGIARAELFDPALASPQGDGCHGFCFHLDPAVLPSLATAAVRIANTGEPVGEAVDFAATNPFEPSAAPGGAVEWTGGLRLTGWVGRSAAPFPARVEAWWNGARVASVPATLWRSVAHGEERRPEPGFALNLPPELADGRAKDIEVLCDGRPLPGSPVRLIAFADGLRAHLLARAETEAEAERGRLFDAAFPQGVPFASLAEWERRFPPPAPATRPSGPIAVVVAGVEGAEDTLASPALETADWVGTMLPPAAEPHRFDPQDLLAFLHAEPGCEVIVFALAGTQVRPFAIERLAAALGDDRTAIIAYCDVVMEAGNGTSMPFALPAFDYERSLEQGVGAFFFAMRREAAIQAAERSVGDLHRLFLAPVEANGVHAGTHLHLPGFGACAPFPAHDGEAVARSVREHLAARGREAAVEPRAGGSLPAVRVSRRAKPQSVAVVLDAGANVDLVSPALAALDATRERRTLRIVVCASAVPADLRQNLHLADIGLAESPAAFSMARRLEQAIEGVEADLVCVLDARLRPAAPDWLGEMLGRFAEDGVGAVAPLVLDAAGFIAQGGFVLDPAGRPLPAFAERRHGDPGYGDALLVARQVAAVGPHCFLTRRTDFLALGGFDPVLFPDTYGSVDYCLKLQALGRRIVVTPDAVLSFAPGTSAAAVELPMARAAREREERALLSRWPEAFARDPFASPLLGRGLPPFAGLAWPPGDRAPRRPGVAPARAVPPGW